jgi:hypothetical protein
MKNKPVVLLFILFFSEVILYSQELSPKVLAPAAGEIYYNNLNYSQTIGQTAVEIIGSSGYVLTQGFQQPLLKVTDNTTPEGNGVDVYPNPATDFLNIKLFGDGARTFRIELINITGTIVKSMNINFVTDFYYVGQMQISDLKIGFYFIRVSSEDRLINRIFKIEKL